MKRISLLLLSFMIWGCTVGPIYHPPTVDLPFAYTRGDAKLSDERGDLRRWWQSFRDPQLSKLIDEALEKNYSLKIAKEKMIEAREFYKIKSAGSTPHFRQSTQLKRERISQSLDDASFLGPKAQTLYQIGFDANWEIDLFGKQRREKECALSLYEGELQNSRALYITLLSEIASTYLEIWALSTDLMLSKEELKNETKRLTLSKTLFESGLESEISLNSMKISLEEIKARIPSLEERLSKAQNRMAILLGRPPQNGIEPFENDQAFPTFSKPIPLGLPSDLLRRRPDIQRAERLLAAATAKVGSSIADLFPRLSLTGSLGLASSEGATLISGKSVSASWGPKIEWHLPLFSRVRSNIRMHRSKERQALLHYEETILLALQEVENALCSYELEKERGLHLEKKAEMSQKNATLASSLYQSGFGELSSLIEAQNSAIQAKRDRIQSAKTETLFLIALYKSLGGEWE